MAYLKLELDVQYVELGLIARFVFQAVPHLFFLLFEPEFKSKTSDWKKEVIKWP